MIALMSFIPRRSCLELRGRGRLLVYCINRPVNAQALPFN
jgi:hypothetical protein